MLCRFANRDMMMRYLGTGVGHRQSADFPRETRQLKAPLQGDSYLDAETWQRRQSSMVSQLNPIGDEAIAEDLLDSEDEECLETIYEP